MSADTGQEVYDVHFTVPLLVVHYGNFTQLAFPGCPEMLFMVVKYLENVCFDSIHVACEHIVVDEGSFGTSPAGIPDPPCSST